MEKEMIDILKTDPAYFGRQGENIAREVIFDITSLKREFPDAVYSLVLKRVDDSRTFTAVATTIDGNEFRYQPTAWATEKAGTGEWEIHAIIAETGMIAKSITGTFVVDDALDDAVDAAPDVAENWISQVTEARDEAVEAARIAQEAVSIDVDAINQAILNKLDRPEQNGTEGQILMTDGIGGQRWADPPETYELPTATPRRLGGVIIGNGIEVDSDGRISAPSASPATEQRDGLLRAIDQKKLNGIEEGANKYVLPKATENDLGGMMAGDNMRVDENGKVDVIIPKAGQNKLGGIIPGNNMQVDENGKADVNIPKAGPNTLGGIKVGRNLSVDEDGTLNSQDSYELPTATPVRLGGVMVGENLSVDENGVLSADAQPIQPATENDLGGIKIGNGLSIDEAGVASAYSYDINKTLKEDGKTYQLNLIRSDGNEEEIVQSVDLPAGGGGGGGGSTEGFYLNIERVTSSPIIMASDNQVLITVDIVSTEQGQPGSDPLFVDGTYVWKIGTSIINELRGAYSRERNTFDLTPYLSNGTQRVSLTVTQSDSGITQTRTWTVQLVDVHLESTFKDEYTNPANQTVAFTYVPYGAVPKVAHFKLDGTELPTVSIPATQSGTTQMYILPASSHGTHTLEVWMVATVGIQEVESNHIYKDIIWYDEEADTPIISCDKKPIRVPAGTTYVPDDSWTYYRKVEGLYEVAEVTDLTWDELVQDGLYYLGNKAKQYSSTSIRFNVYDPTTPTPEVTLWDNGVQVGMRILSESMNNVWVYKTDNSGVHTLTIKCGVASVDIIMDIDALDVDITPVTANLVFDFNPAGRSNSDANRLWSYTNENNDTYSMTVSDDFDWVNGGWQQDEDGDMSFLIKAGTTAEINCKMFERESGQTKRKGQHFKVIFKVDNVRDASATWLSCLGEREEAEAGLRMNVHEAYVYSGNSGTDNPSSLWSPYSEEDRVEFEYDIHPIDIEDNSASSYFLSYEDGTMFRPIIYNNSNILQQLPASTITIGSEDCDVRIYRMKYYDASLDNSDVMNNFIADAPSGEEMYERYVRNQIYDSDGYLTAEHLAEVCPDLRIIKIEAEHFTNKKSNTVANTTVTCIYKNGDPVLDNWTVVNGSHSGQGTTSDNYGVSGRNIDLKFNTDDAVATFGDGSQSSPGKVKISLTRESVPVNYFNIKVNIASSENANNALLAKRYDRYLPYETPAHKRDSKVKTTMEFFNCVVFIKETGDASVREEFDDNNWHFYAIGNIGDSKKTDKTRVYTPNDPKEFVNEIQDNTKSNSRFDTGVYNLLVDSLPVSGERFLDYYLQDAEGKFSLNRYISDEWVIVKAGMTEITNGAAALLNTRPEKGISGIEYYIRNGSGYDMYIWKSSGWSAGASQTASDFEDAKKRHMATAIDPSQWIPGNEKYDKLMADPWDSSDSYEMRYEAAEKVLSDDAAIAAQHAANVQIWNDMYTWLVTSTDERFVSEFENWFVKDAALYAYLFTEQYTMMDNRAKNTFWHWAKIYVSQEEYDLNPEDNQYYIVDNAAAAINNGYRFDFWDYDNDSSLGINNTGALGLSYGKEDIDKVVDDDPTAKNVYNAADSVFFRRIRILMHNDLRSMYQRLENSGCWTASNFLDEFDAWQNQWPEELWTKDMERKYIRPYFGVSMDNSTTVSADGLTVKKSSQYLEEMLNGRKKYQRRQWVRDQYVYMGTKYLASSVTNNSIMLRCYEPSGAVVSPDYTMRIVPYTDMYLSVLFGSGNFPTQVRAKAGVEYELKCPISMSGATDIPFYIYAASNIQELSDLSACYFTTNNFAGATKLKKLKIGNDTPGYSNQIQVLNLGEGRHDLLEILDVTNCHNLVGTTSGGTLNLAGCGRLRELYAGGTAVSSVIFATNGRLETAIMPESLTGLTMIGLDKVVSFVANYDHLVSLNMEGGSGTPDARAIIADAYDTIRSLRLVDIDWSGQNAFADQSILNALSDMSKMYDSYISGYVYIAGAITQSELDHYNTVWPYLEVGYESIMAEYKVSYMNADGTLLAYEFVNAGSALTNPIGRTVLSPAGTNIVLSTPEMEMTDQYVYEFDHWDNMEGYVTRNRTVTAVYNEITRKYTVNWFGKISGLRLASGEYEYGSEAIYDYTPTKDTVKNSEKTYYYRPMVSFIEYKGNWEGRPQLYEHNDIPTDVSGESAEHFKLFSGWDKNTGFVRPDPNNADGHIDVYAIWQECNEVPENGTDPSTLNAAQVYAITRQPYSAIKNFFSMENPDYVPITLGHNPEFLNVESETIIESPRYFDGTSGEIVHDSNGNEIHLFAEDAPSFTMAIDFEMRNGGISNYEKTLIGCYNSEGKLGFRLQCGYRESDGEYRPIIEWGDQSFEVSYSYPYSSGVSYYDARYRDIVVIRHVAGDPTLYVYTSNTSQYFSISGITRYAKARSSYAAMDEPLVLGGVYSTKHNEFSTDQFGSGYIYWCKIWYDDLGEYACQKIAAWPHETVNMEYYGTQRYEMADGARSHASFISRKPLYGRAIQAPGILSGDAVWSNSPARTFLNSRIVDALPNEWASMLCTVRLKNVLSSRPNSEVEVTEDRIYQPAYAEIYPDTGNPFNEEKFYNSLTFNEGSMITWFSDAPHRAKSKILDIRQNQTVWTGTTDPLYQVSNVVQLGDIWVQSTTGGYAVYVFVSKESIERDHLTVRSGSIQNDVGGWVQNNSVWGLRTPNSDYPNQYYVVTASGVVSTASYVPISGYGDGIGINFCFSV